MLPQQIFKNHKIWTQNHKFIKPNFYWLLLPNWGLLSHLNQQLWLLNYTHFRKRNYGVFVFNAANFEKNQMITQKSQNFYLVISLKSKCYQDLIDDDWFDFFIFILLSPESDEGTMHKTNPDSLRSCPCFQVYRLNFAFDFNLLLVRLHQAEIIVVKHLIQGRINEAWVVVEPSSLRSWPS